MSPEPWNELEPGDIPGPIEVAIRRNADGLVRTQSMDLPWRGSYWWDEGNAACDCNRAWWFADAGPEARNDGEKCGHGRFTVLSIKVPSGEVVYSEKPPRPAREVAALALRNLGVVVAVPALEPRECDWLGADAVLAALRGAGVVVPEVLP